MRHPVCATPAQAGARLCAALLALICTLSCAQASPLSSELARNAALPRAPLLDPEGHNARNQVTREAQMHLLLRMLHRYLGGPPAPRPSPAVAGYLARTLRANGALGE